MKVQKYEIARVIDKLKKYCAEERPVSGSGRDSGKGRVFNRLQLRDYNEGQIRGLRRQLFYYSNESL